MEEVCFEVERSTIYICNIVVNCIIVCIVCEILCNPCGAAPSHPAAPVPCALN